MTEPTPNPELDPDNDPDDNEPEDKPWAPPTKEEHEKMLATMATRKKERDAARRELAAEKAKSATTEPTPDPDLKTKRQGAIAALTAAGMTRDQAKSAVRLVDLSTLEVDEDGDVDAEEHVNELKKLHPGLFPAKTPTPRVHTQGGRTTSTPGGDKVTDALLKSAGYR